MIRPNLEGFLLGVIATCSVLAGLVFLRYWRRTRDGLFLAFGAAFLIEGVNRVGFLLLDQPNRGSWVIYLVRLCCSLLILAAIVRKNFGARRRRG
jgi:uncharacterized membrane protein HdeD (DUF308 family)